MRLHNGLITLIALSIQLSYGAACPASAQTVAVTPAKSGTPTCDRHAFHAVVDVGHTVRAPGALSARGVYEYEFNLRLAKEVAQKLKDVGFDRTVLMITAEGPRLGLFRRTEKANALGADLFLSIHHDSVPDGLMQKWQYEGQDHGFNDRFPGHSLFVSFDNPQRGRSIEFAMLLGTQLKAHGLKYTPHYTERFMGHYRHDLVDAETGVYRYDQLVVLRSTRMPAVLLEAGSIVNRDEELALETPERRSLITESVANAVESYCESRAERPAVSLPHGLHAQNVSAPAVKRAAMSRTGSAARQ